MKDKQHTITGMLYGTFFGLGMVLSLSALALLGTVIKNGATVLELVSLALWLAGGAVLTIRSAVHLFSKMRKQDLPLSKGSTTLSPLLSTLILSLAAEYLTQSHQGRRQVH